MHAIVLAGGFGTRLRSAVSDVPKPLAPIQGRPFLSWLLDVLVAHGVTGVTLSVHHDWQKIQEYFNRHPLSVPVDYAVEEKPLGTGGALAFALKSYKGTAPVLALNGDSIVRVDYRKLYQEHARQKATLSMVLREVSDSGRYGTVEVKQHIITAFGEGKAGARGLINAGVYVMEPGIFKNYTLPEAFSFERDFLPEHLAALAPRAFRADDYFIDIGIPADYARACEELPQMMG